ncbi:MAG: type II secretion system protein [Planctomycetota bacterium]|jgi:general secretion pathway protein G
MRAKRGFTLVEILIVVVILGILAAIVVPQFTQASTEAKENSLRSDLQSLRSQIELYKVQHTDVPPGNTVDAAGVVTAAVAQWEPQMIYTTDYMGLNTGSKQRNMALVPPAEFGPYLERVPPNPFTGIDTVAGTAGVPVADGTTCGWFYDPATGEIWANNLGTDELGTPYIDY